MNARTGRTLTLRNIWPLFVFCGMVMWCAMGSCAEPGWFTYQPHGCRDGQGILAEIRSRCDAQGLRNGYHRDQVTCAHESTHMVNSRIRQWFKRPRHNAMYVGGGRCCILPEPRVTLRQVAQFVRPEYRNSTYHLYFDQQAQWWDNQPLYICDEFSAYLNGSQAAKELRCDEHGSNERCRRFAHYADCLVEAVKHYDPTYSHLPQLVQFVDYQKQRVAKLTGGKS